MAKKKDWLDAYMFYSMASSSPAVYHKWIGLGVIASVLQRKVWIEFAYGRVHPNMYTILVSPPGKAMKNGALSFGKKLLKNVRCVKLLEGSTSPQQFVEDIAAQEIMVPMDDGTLLVQSPMTIFADELGTFLQIADPKVMITWLTDWFDNKDNFEYRTKHAGSCDVKGINLNMFAGTTPDWISQFLPTISCGGGFTARTIFIYADKPRHLDAHPRKTAAQKIVESELSEMLNEFAELTGDFVYSDEAKEYMEDWYFKLFNEQQLILDKRFGDYYAKKQAFMFKVAMCIAVARTGTLKIEKKHYEEAHDLLLAAEPGFVKAFGGVGRSTQVAIINDIIEFIEKNKRVKRVDLLKAHWRDATVVEIDAAIAGLQEMKMVELVNTNGKVEYVWR